MEDGSQTRIDPINFSCGSRIFFFFFRKLDWQDCRVKIHSSSVRMQLHLQNPPTLNDETRSLVEKKKNPEVWLEGKWVWWMVWPTCAWHSRTTEEMRMFNECPGWSVEHVCVPVRACVLGFNSGYRLVFHSPFSCFKWSETLKSLKTCQTGMWEKK